MKERRSFERIRLYHYLRIYHRHNRQYAGSVVDISQRGMKVLSEFNFTSESSYKFTIDLPENSAFGTAIDIDAQVRWCTPSTDDPSFEAGFLFTNTVDHGVLAVRNLIKDFKKKELL